jgi:hypothetical protein
MRIGAQIRDFVNRHLNEKIHLIKSVSHNRSFDNVQLPADYIPLVEAYLKKRYLDLKRGPASNMAKRETSKVLGKLPTSCT